MRRAWIVLGISAALLVAAVVVVLRFEPPRLTDRQVRETLFATIQRESSEAFLVTGRLEVTTTTRVENTKVFLPGIVSLDLGTVRSTVRVPGSVLYGFEVDSLKPEMVRMLEDGTIEVEVPPLAVFAVEPNLAGMEVETERGWARMGAAENQVERRAIAIVEAAMRRQGLAHLRDSYQSRINAARALERLLTPALRGLGMTEPKFRFRLGDDIVVERRD